MNVIRNLKNGVKMYALEVENDFAESQTMLDLSVFTENIDSDCAYNERVPFNGVGTYAVKVQREEDYERFSDKFVYEKDEIVREYNIARAEVMHLFVTDGIDSAEFERQNIELNQLLKGHLDNCKKYNFQHISFEEWQSGKLENGQKLGKAMRKAGFSSELLDFYSAQIKDERTLYITVSDRVQHITGMSNYAEEDSWNGHMGTSCQDTRHDIDLCQALGGALHDDRLFIAMLHYSLDDLEDMQDELKARVLMRYVVIDGTPCLVPSRYYGNNITKNELHIGLSQLSEMDIYNNTVRSGFNTERVEEKANGTYTMFIHDEIYVCDTFEDSVEVECPCCRGNGKIREESSRLERMFTVDCPLCNGSGEVEASYYYEVDEYIEVCDEMPIKPYVDDYSHYGHKIVIDVNINEIRRLRGHETVKHEDTRLTDIIESLDEDFELIDELEEDLV